MYKCELRLIKVKHEVNSVKYRNRVQLLTTSCNVYKIERQRFKTQMPIIAELRVIFILENIVYVYD